MINVVNLAEKFSLITKQWDPKIIAQLNDYHFKIAKIQGEFVWHSHPETDEVFLVVDGKLTIQLPDGDLHLSRGELCVIPKGVEHKPAAEQECQILMAEPAGTLNTGDAGGERTIEETEWI
ncbi:MAG: cupin [Chloroflexota bacterium]|nr:MAG: cupin [Chloroflexota bacterium]HDD55250.1 cupin domain-containing protein [Chloroflexota bacterium]